MRKDIIISIFVILFASIHFYHNSYSSTFDEKSHTHISAAETLFGISIEKYFTEKGKITPQLYIGALFQKYNIPAAKISGILDKTNGIFDVRKIRAGNEFSVLMSKDSTKKVDYIIYQKDLVNYVVFDFTDSMKVYNTQKKVETIVKTASGTIETTLWSAMEKNNINPLFANDLSDVYAWTVDFFGLQTGDNFKVIYEENFVDGQSIGFGKIHSAVFNHYGKDIYAIPFFQDSATSFFDADGASLKKAFLKAPLKFTHIGSGFTSHRLHPILKIVRPHYGVDYSAPTGTPVYSIGDGVVTMAGWQNQSGNMVRIRHNSVFETAYLHLSKYGEGIHAGMHVKQGDIIGYVGSTGLSTGPHLDFRVWKNGTPVNPLNIDAPPVSPVKPENLQAFTEAKEKWMPKLNEIKFQTPDLTAITEITILHGTFPIYNSSIK